MCAISNKTEDYFYTKYFTLLAWKMAVKKFVVYSFIESSGCGQLEFLLVAMDSTIDMGQSGIKTTPVAKSSSLLFQMLTLVLQKLNTYITSICSLHL